MSILIVDYSSFMREQLKRMLLLVEGVCQVHEASNMFEAKHLICLNQINVVILDEQIIGGKGIDLLKFIQDVKEPPVMIISLLHDNNHNLKEKWHNLGSQYPLDKYRELMQIPSIVKRHMNSMANYYSLPS